MSFYIHIADPGFPEHPWPGMRRLGPYLTAEEAVEQAVSDAAGGAGVAEGVYSEDESVKRYEGGREGKAHTTRSTIRQRGEARARQAQKKTLDELQQSVKDFEAMLPAGVNAEELLAAAQETAARIARHQSYPPTIHPEPIKDDDGTP